VVYREGWNVAERGRRGIWARHVTRINKSVASEITTVVTSTSTTSTTSSFTLHSPPWHPPSPSQCSTSQTQRQAREREWDRDTIWEQTTLACMRSLIVAYKHTNSPVVPFYLPRTWKESGSDPFGSSAMAIAGGSMMLKNAWVLAVVEEIHHDGV
jgi:hypothetical protein